MYTPHFNAIHGRACQYDNTILKSQAITSQCALVVGIISTFTTLSISVAMFSNGL